MEVEQDRSSFISSRETLVPTGSFYDRQVKATSRFRLADETDRMLEKATGLSYRWLDSISDVKSYAVVADDLLAAAPYRAVLQLLRKAGYVSSATLQDWRFNDLPHFFRFDITPAYPSGSTDRSLTSSFAHASGKDPEETLSKAIGEFLERYFLTLYHKKDMMRASMKSLKQRGISHLDVRTLAGFSEEQKQAKLRFQWDEDSVFYWEKAFRVSTGESVYLPAQLIFWNYEVEPPEPILRERNTNGAGGYFSKEGAILSGLYELIQRDAFLIHWLNSHAPPRVNPESVPNETFQRILRESKRYGFETHCLNTTLDTGVPSFIVVAEDRASNGFGITMGGGCGPDPVSALLNAAQEVWSVYGWMRRQGQPFTLPEGFRPFAEPSIGQNERILLWTNPAMAEHFRFFLNGKSGQFNEAAFPYPSRFPSESAELQFLTNRVEAMGRGYEVYAYLPNDPVLKQLGYAAAKVIVPQVVPLYLQEIYAPLGAELLRSVPQKFGWDVSQAFNPWPHPFP